MPASPVVDNEVGVDDGWGGALSFLRYQLRHHFEDDLNRLNDVVVNADGLEYSTSSGLYLPAPKRIYTQATPTPDNLRPRAEATCLCVGPSLATQKDDDFRGLSGAGAFGQRVELPFGIALMLQACANEPARDTEEDEQGRPPIAGQAFEGRLLDDDEILTHRALAYIGALKYTLLTRCENSPVCNQLRIVDDYSVQFSTQVANAAGATIQLAINVVYIEVRVEQHQYVPKPT